MHVHANSLLVAATAAVLAGPSLTAQIGRETFGPLDLDAATGVASSLGVATLGGVAFVSARGSVGSGGSPPHTLTAIDLATGAVLNQALQTPLATVSDWGFRDGTSDGVHLMFGHERGIEVITAASALSASAVTLANVVMADNGPQTIVNPIRFAGASVHRGLAFDPSGNGGRGSIWVGDFRDDIWEIDLNGTLLRTLPSNGWSIYGLAYDHDSRMLWVSTNRNRGDIAELDPQTGQFTGRLFTRTAASAGSNQGGMSLANGLDGRGCGFDLITVDQSDPDNLTGYRMQLWDTLRSVDERQVVTGVDGGSLGPGGLTVRRAANASVEIDLDGTPGAAFAILMNIGPVASIRQAVPSPVSSVFPSLWELAVSTSASTLIQTTPLTIGNPLSLPTAAMPLGKIKVQGVSLNSGIIAAANPCGLALALEVSQPSCLDVIAGSQTCGVSASAIGPNSLNAVTTSGFWRVRNLTGQNITAMRLNLRAGDPSLRIRVIQTGMNGRFDGGNAATTLCSNTYRNNSDVTTGLVYAGTDQSICSVSAMTGWNASLPFLSNPQDFQVFDFAFNDFGNGELFEFDAATRGGPGANGNSMAGAMWTVTLADGTVCSGRLVPDRGGNPNLSSVFF